MALVESVAIQPGAAAPNFNLRGTDEKMHALTDYRGTKLLLVIFQCNHCPYAKAAWDPLLDLHDKFAERGLTIVAINPNDPAIYPDDSFENMQKEVEARGIPFDYLFDETQQVAKSYDAQCTPDPYLYDADHKLIYHGRINDNWQEPDKVTSRDLESAIGAALAGESITAKQIPSMGCSIKWSDA